MDKEIYVSQFYVKHLMSYFTQKGVDASKFTPKASWGDQITALTVPLYDFINLCEFGQVESGSPLIAMETAAKTLPPSHGAIGLLLASCQTMGEAIQLGYKFQHITRTGHLSYLNFDGDTVTTRLDTSGADDEYIAPFVEYCYGSFYAMSNYLLGMLEPVEALEIHFKHQPRAPINHYRKLLSCKNIKFSQSENIIVFPRTLMDKPIYLSDSSNKDMLIGEVNRQLQEQNRSNGLSEKIKQLLKQQEPFNPISLEECAEQLKLSPSTLKRKLQEEETNYRTLLDVVRADIATHLLRESALSIEEISINTGFTNTAAFSRAFKRWKGQTPQKFRQLSLE